MKKCVKFRVKNAMKMCVKFRVKNAINLSQKILPLKNV